jgi:hypothetical protein
VATFEQPLQLDAFMQEAIVPGTLLPDGTLQLHRPVPLPPGNVEVVVRAQTRAGVGSTNPESTLRVLQEIWAESQQSGHKPRSAEEIDRDLSELRAEAERRQQSIERSPFGIQPAEIDPPC